MHSSFVNMNALNAVLFGPGVSRHYDTDQKLLPHQTGRPLLAAFQHDENSQCGFSRAHQKRAPRRSTLASSAQKRQYTSSPSQNGGILFCRRRRWTHADWRANNHRAQTWWRPRWTGTVAPGIQRYRERCPLADHRCARKGTGTGRTIGSKTTLSNRPNPTSSGVERSHLAAEKLTELKLSALILETWFWSVCV